MIAPPLSLLAEVPAAAASASSVTSPWPFGLLALVAVVSAVMVVARRKTLVCALFLVLHLLAVAGLYALLGAFVLAALQVIIYAGAILVLIVFVVMLLNVRRESEGGRSAATTTIGIGVGALLALALGRAARDLSTQTPDGVSPGFGTVARLGDAIFGAYFFPFELVSLVIVAGMVGAVILAKRKLED